MVKYILILSIFIPAWSFGQEAKLSEVIINIAEELAADDSDPEAVSTYIERLYDLSENPVKINSNGENELSRLFFLSDFQVKALVDYAHSSGRIISVYELVNIPGFDKETAEMMIPFISLDSKMTINTDSVKWRDNLLTNLSFKPGNDDTTSLGSPWKILSKYKFTAGGFSGGMTVEKDPGEKILTGYPPLPDFLSANLAYNGRGLIRRLIVGDYSSRFGQGTNINTGIRRGISLTAPGYMSASDEIKPYTSTDENNFFRGVAAELSHKNTELFLFYSKNYGDATLGSSLNNSEAYIENFYSSGIHNTPSLLVKKDAISELVYGINMSCNLNNIRIGLTWSENRLSLPVKPASNDPKNNFAFEGDRNSLYTIYYNSLINRILLYGEFSANEKNKYAFVQGLSFRPSDRLTINFLFRNYNAGYISLHGNGPGSGSATGNERAILGNFTFEAAKHLFISGGCDLQHFLWIKYRCSSPSLAMKQELLIKFLPTEKLTFDASYSYRLSMVDNPETYGIPELKQIITRSVKLSSRYSLYENLILGMRIDYKVAYPLRSRGMLLLYDMNYRFTQLPFTIWFRYCVFNTDTWDSRLYTYENDLLYSFSIPALSGEGSRSYIMVKWEISDIAELRIKYGITSKSKNGVSLEDNKELKIQVGIRF